MKTQTRNARILFATIFVAAVMGGSLGCKGDAGTNGTNGVDGLGKSAKDTGTISGRVLITATTSPAAGVKVVANPGAVTTNSDNDGQYTIQVPIGIYTITFGAGLNNDGFDPITVQNISVVGGASVSVNANVVRSNPLVLTFPAVVQAGFGKAVRLGVTVSGVPSGATPTYAWTQTGGPPVTLSGPNTAQPTFTTRKVGDLVNARPALTNVAVPVRKGSVAIATQHETEFSYTFKATVTAGSFVKSNTTSVLSATVTAGAPVAPVGVNLILGSPEQARYAWAITAKPAGSNAILDYPTEQFATFVPDVEGQYTVSETGSSTAWNKSFVVSSYKGPGTADIPGCTTCHAAFTPDQVTKWNASKHKSLFRLGITGVASDHYSSSCITCHTTGNFMQGTIKGGFGDVASQLHWTFPTTLTPSNWTNLPPALQDLGSISCESCHGPGSQHMAGPRVSGSISKSMATQTCNQCHEAIGHHDRGFLISRGAHHDLQLTLDEATVEGRGTTAAHCGRCHSAQGFKEYLSQLRNGNTGSLIPPAGRDLLSWLRDDLGLTEASVDNPGCATCHEPHAAELRLEGNTPVLPAGFAFGAAGKGAICMACHNTRNGLHDATHPPTSTSAPHTPSQTDLLAGKNAYFVNTDMAISRHAAAADTCATCHVALIPTGLSILPANYQMPGTNHTFKVNSTICKSCHSAEVTGEALQAEVSDGLANLATVAGRVLYGTYLQPYLNPGFDVTAYNQATDAYSTVDGTNPGPVTITALPANSSSISFALEIHGQESACLTLPAPISVNWTNGTTTTITNLCFQLSSVRIQGTSTQIIPNNSDLVKALWNYYLVKSDGSFGIHNPTFVFQILSNTQAQLN